MKNCNTNNFYNNFSFNDNDACFSVQSNWDGCLCCCRRSNNKLKRKHHHHHQHRTSSKHRRLTANSLCCCLLSTCNFTDLSLIHNHNQNHHHHHYLRFKSVSRIFSFKSVFLCSLWIALLVLVRPTKSSEFPTNIATQQTKNSGQFFISQLCASKSQLPITKRVEGAVLASTADVDVNCTVTFRTRSAQQYFVIRFEELKLGCDDHLKMFDGDLDYGQQSIKDFSCKDSLASVPIIRTTGTFLTMRFSSDSKTKIDDGFRLVATAVFDAHYWDCPADYSLCSNRLCISRSLFCDGVNHCLDNSDELGCSSKIGSITGAGANSNGSFLSGELTLSNALGLLVILVLIIFTCVIIFITLVYCRRESHYAQYQHHLQRAIGVPLQTSSSLMFTNHQPQYHYFQPANLSPYITPQHNAALVSTLPRGYSTLPLNLAAGRQAQINQVQQQQLQQHRQQQMQQHQQLQQFQQSTPIAANKANNIGGQPNEYLMMAGLTGPPTAAMQAAPTMQTNLFLPTSQSILATDVRYQPPQEPRR